MPMMSTPPHVGTHFGSGHALHAQCRTYSPLPHDFRGLQTHDLGAAVQVPVPVALYTHEEMMVKMFRQVHKFT